MPELPEVETVRSQLASSVIGLHIGSITFPDRASKVLKGKLEEVIGQKIVNARRFGKLLIIDLSDQKSFCIHLKMTGRLSLVEENDTLPSHTHIIFHLGKKRLIFSDARKFGFVHVLSTEEVENLSFIQKLGKEPLKDLGFSHFEQILNRSARPIKSLLLDQQKIAGIGNIYACEALWMAAIDPRTPSKEIPLKKRKILFTAIEEVLQEGIKRGGASDNSYRNLFGGKGDYQNFFKVYGQTGKPCPRCGNRIERMVQAGRGTFWCPNCQTH